MALTTSFESTPLNRLLLTDAERGGTIAGVVLAAGPSSRMGRQKLLLPLAGTSLVRRVVERVLAAGLDGVTVVLGRDGQAIREELAGLACRFVENPAYRDGLGTSFRAAIASLDAGIEAALFALADMPFVTAEMLRALLATYRRTHALATISRFGGVIAPPHLFTRDLFPRVGAPASSGAAGVLREYGERCDVVDQPAIGLVDVDEWRDYERALALAAAEH